MWHRLVELFSRSGGAAGGSDSFSPSQVGRLRAAFPPAAPSDALRARIAGVCRSAATPDSRRRLSFPAAAARYRFALAGTALLLLGGLALAPGERGGRAEASASCGQLTILDPRGQAAGLCPLEHTDVQANIEGFVARVTVEQEFRNPSREPVEAVYTFPLPGDAAVDRMTMRVGDRTIRGEIRRAEEARQVYDAARAAGKSAALLEQERPNIFTQSVANLMPGERVSITIGYVQLLKYDREGYEFVFPMVVGPRFTPTGGYQVPGRRGQPALPAATGEEGDTRAFVRDPDRITPPIAPPGTRAGHDISLTVNLDAGVPVRGIESVLHPVNVTAEGPTRRTVRLRDEATLPNRDFILRYAVAGEGVQTALLAHAGEGGGGHFALVLQPPAVPVDAVPPSREIVFVIDQSGSQAGWPIAKAKETMATLIQRLNPDDTFQLLGFNTEVYPCFEQPVRNTPENVARAMRFLEPLEGEGGTEVLQAVDYALRIPDEPRRRRIVCYLTDGYVGNDMQTLAYVRKHRGRAHMFPIGIGNSVNRFLIDGMAREGGGIPEYVTLRSSAREAAARFYRRIAQPLLVGVEADWSGLPVTDFTPSRIPDLFVAGRPVVIHGRFTRPGSGVLTLRGTLAGRPWSETVPVDFPARSQGDSPLPSLWARERIEELQSADWLGAQTGRPDADVTEKIVNLALDYGLMTQHTAFVAVEQRVVNVGGRQRMVDVPVEMADGVSHDAIFAGDEGARMADASTGWHWGVEGGTQAGAPGQVAQWYELYRRPRGEAKAARAGSAASSSGAPDVSFNSVPGTAPSRNGPPSYLEGRGAYVDTRYLEETERSGRSPAAPPAVAGRSYGIDVGDFAHKLPTTARGVAEKRPASGQVPKSPIAPPRMKARRLDRRSSLTSVFDPTAAPSPEARLAPELLALLERPARQSSAAAFGKSTEQVEVQIWLAEVPKDAMQQLKALGFELLATLRAGQLVLGHLPLAKLREVAALEFVRRIEPPRYR